MEQPSRGTRRGTSPGCVSLRAAGACGVSRFAASSSAPYWSVARYVTSSVGSRGQAMRRYSSTGFSTAPSVQASRPRAWTRSRYEPGPAAVSLARDRLAVADGEEPVAAAVNDERGDLDLGQALAPAGFTVGPGEHHAHLVCHLDRGEPPGVRSQMRAAIARAATGPSPRISALAAAKSATPPLGRSNGASGARTTGSSSPGRGRGGHRRAGRGPPRGCPPG